MKKIVLLLFVFLFTHVNAQVIVNSGFEDWGDGNPLNWVVCSSQLVSQSNDSYSGNFALRMEIGATKRDFQPVEAASELFAVSEKYSYLTGYYKFFESASSEAQKIYIDILFWHNGQMAGLGSINIYSPASTYTKFLVPIEYYKKEIPDSAYIYISLSDVNDETGSGAYALFDDLGLETLVNADENFDPVLSEYCLTQNYPNPFNPSTRIEYSVAEGSFVELKVYDIIGNEVASLVNEYKPAGGYSTEFIASSLPSGIYIARLNAGSSSKMIKMTLMK